MLAAWWFQATTDSKQRLIEIACSKTDEEDEDCTAIKKIIVDL